MDYKDLKVPFFTILFIFFFFYLYTKLAGPVPFYINSIQTTKTDLFQVSGTGQVSAVPDMATISFSVTKQANTVADAQNQTNSAISQILSALRNSGISDQNIKTTSYNVEPNYDFSSGQKITGYTASQDVQVKLTSLDKVNQTLDTVTGNGANVVGGVSFGFSDTFSQKLQDQARQIAVTQAKQKAQSLANAAGIHLGQIVNVTENNPAPLPIVHPLALSAQPSQSQPTQVTPGQNTVSSTITLSYQTY